jgi:thioredoxin 1
MATVKMLYRALVVLALAGAIAAVLVIKQREEVPQAEPPKPPEVAALPRLVDLGAGKCASCKMMTPVLEELKREFADLFSVAFIDVWEQTEAAEEYGIRMIPTQIFYDASGKELYRHEGFFSREDILEVWQKYGVGR